MFCLVKGYQSNVQTSHLFVKDTGYDETFLIPVLTEAQADPEVPCPSKSQGYVRSSNNNNLPQ